MGTRKQPKAKAKKPVAAKGAASAKPKAARGKASPSTTSTADLDANATDVDDPNAELRIAMIAHAAYLRAEQRGFAPGKELDDWLAAAADVDAQLERRRGA